MKHFALRQTLPLACVALLAALSLGAGYLSYLAISLNPGDELSVHLDGTTISSASSGAGDSFPIVAAQPYLAQGNIVVMQGAPGQGHIVSITPATSSKPAAVAVQLDWIMAIDGQHVAIVATKKGDPLIFGAGGPTEKNFPKDKPVTVGPDVVFSAFVAEQRTIQINQQ